LTIGALDPATTALLVVDMQNDFCEADGFYASIGTGVDPVLGIVPAIQRLLDGARGLGVFVLYTAITYRDAATGVPTDLTEVHTLLPPTFRSFEPRLVSGTWGAQVTERLAPRPNEIVVEKPGYSIFFQTQVESLLRRRGVKTLLLTGAATNGCVIHSAYDAFVRDFDVVLVDGAIISYWPELHDAAMKIMGAMIGPVATSDEALTSLREHRPQPDLAHEGSA